MSDAPRALERVEVAFASVATRIVAMRTGLLRQTTVQEAARHGNS